MHNYHSLRGTFEKVPQGSVSKSKVHKLPAKNNKIPVGKTEKGKGEQRNALRQIDET
jgi:hypothetical protein